MTDLTPRRLTILRFIDAYCEERGYSPSLREIGRGCGISSCSVADYNIGRLAEFGLIVKAPEIARSIRLTEKGREALNERRR